MPGGPPAAPPRPTRPGQSRGSPRGGKHVYNNNTTATNNNENKQ